MTDLTSEIAKETAHIKDIRRRYELLYTQNIDEDTCYLCDPWRVLKIMMQKFKETEEQVIIKWETSDIDHPIKMDDEIFWLEK